MRDLINQMFYLLKFLQFLNQSIFIIICAEILGNKKLCR